MEYGRVQPPMIVNFGGSYGGQLGVLTVCICNWQPEGRDRTTHEAARLEHPLFNGQRSKGGVGSILSKCPSTHGAECILDSGSTFKWAAWEAPASSAERSSLTCAVTNQNTDRFCVL